MGTAVKVHPLAVVLAVAAGGFLFGLALRRAREVLRPLHAEPWTAWVLARFPEGAALHTLEPEEPDACDPQALLASLTLTEQQVAGLVADGASVVIHSVADRPAAVREALVADVPVGGGKVVGQSVVAQPTEGSFTAFSSTCPHAGCAVWEVTNGTIICPCHGSQFDASTGDVTGGPATAGLEKRTVRRTGDTLVVS